MNSAKQRDGDDERFMREAIELSLRTLTESRGGPFGAVVVRDAEVVGRGFNSVTSKNDPTAHAEIEAIRGACSTLSSFQLDDCSLYTSCEPCPMCLGAIYWARIARVYYACSREDAAKFGFDDELIYREISLPFVDRRIPISQLMRDPALEAFRRWESNPDRVPY